MKKLYTFLLVILFVALPGTLRAASVYNSDFKSHRIEIKYSGGKQYFVTVYNSSTHYFDCSYGCQIRVVRTGYTRTLNSDAAAVVIDDGKLRVR
jgi:hypothetical protein